MDGVQSIGRLIMSAFQKLPGVSDLIGTTGQNTWELVAGILTILAYILAVCCIVAGIVTWALKRMKNETEGKEGKKPIYFLIGGCVAGGVLILLPSIILIVGSALGTIAQTNQ